MTRVPYDKLLINHVCSSRTREYCPSVVCTDVAAVGLARANIPQYGPRVGVGKRILFWQPKCTLLYYLY